MPPSAASKRPTRSRVAPENAPRTCPNSSLSASSRGMAAQLSSTNGPSAARAALVDRARGQLLARPRLAQHQHRRVGAGDRRDLLANHAQLVAVADQVFDRVGIGAPPQVLVLDQQLVAHRLDLRERARGRDRRRGVVGDDAQHVDAPRV